MFGRNDKKNDWMAPEAAMAEPVLDPGDTHTVQSVTVELRDRITRVEQQVMAQYTATAAYATLAQQGAENARAEARARPKRSANCASDTVAPGMISHRTIARYRTSKAWSLWRLTTGALAPGSPMASTGTGDAPAIDALGFIFRLHPS